MSATEKYYNPLSIGDASVPIGTLVADITNASTAMSCAGINALVPVFRISIDNEAMLVTSNIAGVQFMTRGIEGTTAVAHAAGASIYPIVTAASLLNNPLALTTSGDIPYLDASLNQARLPAGGSTTILQGGTVPSWTAAPTIGTSVTSPMHIGGTTTTSALTLRSTSGVGTTNADIVFQVGNNGATEAMRIINSGQLGIGTSGATATVHIQGSATGQTSYALKIDDSAGGNIFNCRDDAYIIVGSGSKVAQFEINSSNALAGVFSSAYNSGSSNIIKYKDYNGATRMVLDMSAGTADGSLLGIGATSPLAKVHIDSATEQLRMSYDSSHYVSHTVSSVGSLTIAPTGTNPSITLTPAGSGVVNLNGPISAAGTAGVTAGPFTIITGITVKNGIVTALTGS